MIKIGMLLPYEDMLLIAKRVIEETGIPVDYIKVHTYPFLQPACLLN